MNISMMSMQLLGVQGVTSHLPIQQKPGRFGPLLSPLKGSNPRKGRRPSSWENSRRLPIFVCFTDCAIKSDIGVQRNENEILKYIIICIYLYIYINWNSRIMCLPLLFNPVPVWQFGKLQWHPKFWSYPSWLVSESQIPPILLRFILMIHRMHPNKNNNMYSIL